jgi:cytosine/adenosine deaminase-related metal-dependent hydrolase
MSFTLLNGRFWDDNTHEFILRDVHLTHIGRFHKQPFLANGGGEKPFIDLNGAIVLPGLINAHDHLAMNHFPRTSFRPVYPNAHVWGEDVNGKLDTEPYRSLRAAPLADKVFIGALKNLLSGVTTVVHHDAPHKPLFARDFPVNVLGDYGWAHTLHFTPREEVIRSYRQTPLNALWFIHLAEGTDEVAQTEYARLKEWGCVGANTVLIHGVGLTDTDIADAAPRVRALVVCPSTNRYLLGAQPPIEKWQATGGTVLYGSDSRLTAEGDLLTELRHFSPAQLAQQMSLTARTLKLPHTGVLREASQPDFVILGGMARNQVRLVVRNGHPWIGDPDLMAQFGTKTVTAQVDGVEKRIDAGLARRIQACSLQEPGLQMDAPYIQRWFFSR